MSFPWSGRGRSPSRLVSIQGVVEVPDAGEEGADAELFDPSRHTAREVIAYVQDHPGELGDVLAAERQGKGRASVLALGE